MEYVWPKKDQLLDGLLLTMLYKTWLLFLSLETIFQWKFLLHQCNVQLQSAICHKPRALNKEKRLWECHTVNIYRYKPIEANGNTGVIPTTSKSFSLYWEFLKPLYSVIHNSIAPSKELCSKMALGEEGVTPMMMPHPCPSASRLLMTFF